MLLTIDIGNTNITMGIYEGDDLLFTSRLATDRKRTSDQYAVELLNIFNLHNLVGIGEREECLKESLCYIR